MPTYNFIHPETKAKISVTGDSPPDEATLDQIFSETAGQSAAPKQSYDDFKTDFIKSQATDDYKIRSANSDAFSGMKNMARKALPYVRPIIEGGGALVGGTVGAGGGLLTGAPTVVGAPATTILGGAAGAGLGYSTAKTSMDALEEYLGGTPNSDKLRSRTLSERMIDPVYDAALGSTFEVGGQALAPVAGAMLRGGKATAKAAMSPAETWNNLAKKSAAKKIAQASTKDGRVAINSAKNQKVYDALKAKLGEDYQLTPAQITDDPELLKMQQGLQFSHVPSNGPSSRAMLESQMMGNRDAVGNYLDSKFTGSLDDFLSAVDSEVKGRAANVSRAAQGLSAADKEVASQQIKDAEIKVRSALKGKADALYGQVPRDMQMDSTPLYRTLQELGDSVDPAFANPKSMPSRMINSAEGALAPTPTTILASDGMPYNAPRVAQDIPDKISYDQLMQYNSQVTEALRQAKASGDFSRAKNLSEIKNGIQQTLGFAEQAGQGQAVDALKKANSFYRDTYVPTVRQGNTAKNLATDRTGGFRVDDEISAGRYLQTGDKGLASANDFNRTFDSDQNARQSLLDYAKRDLYDHATANGTTPLQLNKVEGWIAERMPAMKKMGMENEFSGVKEALVKQSEVEAFGKVLNTNDPNSMLKGLLAANGDKSIAKTALQLKLMVRGNPAAENGLKKAVADLMMDNTQLVKEIGGNPIVSDAKMKEFWKQYGPAMQQIYSKSELEALKTVRTAFKIENRIGRSITGVDGAQTRTMEQEVSQATSRAMPMMSMAGRVIRFALDFATRSKGQTTKDFMAKAQFDPVFAKELSDLANKTKSMSTQAAREEVNKFMGKAMTFGAAVSSSALRDTQN